MTDIPTLMHLPERFTALIPVSAPQADIREVMGAGIGELLGALAAQHISPTGPWFTRHLHRPAAQWDFEISIPVPGPMTPAGRVVNGRWPAMHAARTVYHGAYEGLGDAWENLLAWIEAQGLQTSADLWECYAVGPDSTHDPAQWRTELIQPLR